MALIYNKPPPDQIPPIKKKPDNSAMFYEKPVLPNGVVERFQEKVTTSKDPKEEEYGIKEWCPITDNTFMMGVSESC